MPRRIMLVYVLCAALMRTTSPLKTHINIQMCPKTWNRKSCIISHGQTRFCLGSHGYFPSSLSYGSQNRMYCSVCDLDTVHEARPLLFYHFILLFFYFVLLLFFSTLSLAHLMENTAGDLLLDW